MVTRLAWQCISTYRSTDYLGGCNGARIRFENHLKYKINKVDLRFPPGKDWDVNKNLDRALDLLSPIKSRHGPGLSWADLIVLAGNTALELSNTDLRLPFCPGRTDDTRGEGWEDLQPRKDSLNIFICGMTLKWRIFFEYSIIESEEKNNNE